MNGQVEIETAVALLFVRSQGDLSLALQQVNGLLAFRRRCRWTQCRDKVLAVCFGRDLDSGLPACSAAGDPYRTTRARPTPPGVSVAIRESFSLAGIWTLSWLHGPGLRGTLDRVQQREAIFRAFVDLSEEPDSFASFCPVFAQDESPESVAMEMRCLRERYPLLVGLFRFRQDSSHGVYCEETVCNESCLRN
jgi:hypothetical protein